MNLHDSHYREIEKTSEEPIIAMEREACRGLPEALHGQAKRNLCNALAIKHERRAGHKDDSKQEFAKAFNYRHRAQTGEWMK